MTAYGEIRRGQLGGEIIYPEYHVISERSAIDQALKLLNITPVPELPPPEISLDDLALGRHPVQRRLILEELLGP